MLKAAVCGDVFASPSVDAVLAGILTAIGPTGCLLIVIDDIKALSRPMALAA